MTTNMMAGKQITTQSSMFHCLPNRLLEKNGRKLSQLQKLQRDAFFQVKFQIHVQSHCLLNHLLKERGRKLTHEQTMGRSQHLQRDACFQSKMQMFIQTQMFKNWRLKNKFNLTISVQIHLAQESRGHFSLHLNHFSTACPKLQQDKSCLKSNFPQLQIKSTGRKLSPFMKSSEKLIHTCSIVAQQTT